MISGRIALVALAAAVPVTASAQASIEGRWKNPKGSVVVRIMPCGNVYCGTVIDASEKAKANARRGGTQHLVGTRILSGVRRAGDGTFKGQAFDPKREHPRPGNHPPGRSERDRRARLRAGRDAVVQGTALDARQLTVISAPISPARTAAWSAAISSAQ